MLFYARHGESLANRDGYFAGLIDSPLTDTGVGQAERIVSSLKTNGIVIDTLVTSPLKRAYDSAVIVAEGLRTPALEIEVDTRIVEYDFGSLTGKPKKGIDHEAFYAAADRESPDNFRRRVYSAMTDYRGREQRILVVGHSFVRLMMIAIASQTDYTRFNEIPSDPNDNGLITNINF